MRFESHQRSSLQTWLDTARSFEHPRQRASSSRRINGYGSRNRFFVSVVFELHTVDAAVSDNQIDDARIFANLGAHIDCATQQTLVHLRATEAERDGARAEPIAGNRNMGAGLRIKDCFRQLRGVAG